MAESEVKHIKGKPMKSGKIQVISDIFVSLNH